MKKIIYFALLVFVLVLTVFFVSAQSNPIGFITSQGLSLAGVPSQITSLVDLGVCASTGGGGCFLELGKGLILDTALSAMPPPFQQVASLYNKVQPLLKDNKAQITEEIALSEEGAQQGGLNLNEGENADISKFVSSDLEDGSIKTTGTDISFDNGITSIKFDKPNGKLEINGHVFEGIADGEIKLNNKGNIDSADFNTDILNRNYNFNGLEVSVPGESHVVFNPLNSLGGSEALQITMPGGSSVSGLPSFGEGFAGSVEYFSEEGSYTLPDKTIVEGKLKFSESIPEGFIPQGEEVVFYDKVLVNSQSGLIKLSKDPVLGESNFYPVNDNMYHAYGKMNIRFSSGEGEALIRLNEAGVYLDTTDDLNIDVWGEDADFYVGNKLWKYDGENLRKDPFYGWGKEKLDSDVYITPNNLEYVNGEYKYVEGEEKFIEGKKLKEVEGVEGVGNENKGFFGKLTDKGKKVLGIESSISSDVKESTNINEAKDLEGIGGSRLVKPADLIEGSSTITSRYGNRVHPIYKKERFHDGLDIAAKSGTPIKSYSSGKVIDAGYNKELGNFIYVDHGNGLITKYGHASKISVKKGDIVSSGTILGEVGQTGVATGNHLHFSASRNGKSVDPESLFE